MTDRMRVEQCMRKCGGRKGGDVLQAVGKPAWPQLDGWLIKRRTANSISVQGASVKRKA